MSLQETARRTALKSIFEAVYEVLVRLGQASIGDQERFVEYHCEQHDPEARSCGNGTEWRFGGNLGMGGKFWVSIEHFWVSCYSEDRNPKRVAATARINEALKPLFERWRLHCMDVNNGLL